ncbi:MAG: bifunctional precorrin-2 dehydrogenase/sirohydrochlorin ferrochelatase [Phycisphaerae bacterium]|nr:bifunctional precorrin-2 dehydrogenase/sirohydrochlorin ferrochelatase [Phycisphaerae bacterium]
MSNLYPIFTNLRGRDVLVVGGGTIASHKVQALLDAGAKIKLVSPVVCQCLTDLADNDQLEIHTRAYESSDMQDVFLVIAAVPDGPLARLIAGDAEKKHILCNIVDCTELCSFQVPSVVRNGLLQVAVSTSGASPALAKKIRKELTEKYGSAYDELLGIMQSLRKRLKSEYPDDQPLRAAIMEDVVNSEILELIYQNKIAEIDFMVEKIISEHTSK